MAYALRRLPQLIVVLFAVTLLTFLSINLLGDPLKAILGPQYADRELREQVRKDLNLDEPVPVRYVKWLGDAATGDLGRSYNTRESVSSILADRIPVSALLMVYAQVLALLIALPIGIIAAAKADTWFDKIDDDGDVRLRRDPELRPRRAPPVLLRGAERRVPVALPRRLAPGPAVLALPACTHARAPRGGDLHAPAPSRHDQHAAGGLHHHREVQGPAVAPHPPAPRAAAFELLARHRLRPDDRCAARRRARRREHLLDPGHRQGRRRRDLPQGLPRGAEPSSSSSRSRTSS